jgi:hypothetical protein
MGDQVSSVEWAWQRQSVWSQTADRLRRGPSRARRWALALTIAAAASALGSSQLQSTHRSLSVSLAVLAAVLGTAVAVLRGTRSQEAVARWTRARATGEALKTLVFEHLAGADDTGIAARDQALEAAVRSLEIEASDLERFADGIAPRARSLPDVHDVPSYLEHRVRQQVEQYYRPKAERYGRQVRLMRAAETALALVAAALGALAATAPAVGAWASVATTAAAAVAAHAAAERYEFLMVEYSRTASQLRRLLTRPVGAHGEPLSGSALVRECEQVIAMQNQSWRSKWARVQADAATGSGAGSEPAT